MTHDSNLWIALATLAYAVLTLCISALNVRHNRARQWWKREDDIECRRKEED